MRFVDSLTASRSAVDLAARLTSGGRTRVDVDDVLDYLAELEPDNDPVTVRVSGSAIVIVTAADVSTSSKRLLTAYAPGGATVVFHDLDGADAE